jgi:1-acyl-sn-glycerol-3-phosphate acyltransferase
MFEQPGFQGPARPGGACGREPLIAAITTFLTGQDEHRMEDIRVSLEHEIDQAGPDALASLSHRLATAGATWSFFPRDPLARRIHHVLADKILEHDPVLFGVEHLAAVRNDPVVIFANHLSYADANLLEVVFERAGYGALSDRLTVVAGPKVYSNLKRRFSSLCFGTIKTPQSSSLSSEDAVMNNREVARAARRSIDIAHDRLRMGEALLVFPEGSRSRTNSLQQMLAGVARYLEQPETWVLPVGIIGTEAMFPIGSETLHPVPTTTVVGRPIESSRLLYHADGDRQLIMDGMGLAIADLLTPSYRGAYADESSHLAPARRLLSTLHG